MSAFIKIRLTGESRKNALVWERKRAFKKCCSTFNPDFVIIEYIWNTYLLDIFCRPCKRPIVLLDTIDIQHVRTEMFDALKAPIRFRMSRQEEQEALCRYDVLIGIQEKESATLKDLCQQCSVVTVGHTIPVKPYRRVATGDFVRMVFLAGPGTHNVVAIEWFLVHVWPYLYSKHGQKLRLLIAGGICEELRSIFCLPGVEILGFVEDIDTLYAKCDIAINPVIVGSGLKIKNIEALCYSLPLVTTPIGAEGIEQGSGVSFYVAKDEVEMRAMLDRLISRPQEREKLARSAHAFAKQYLQTDIVFKPLLEMLEMY